MHLKNGNGILNKAGSPFLRGLVREEMMDDSTFHLWKTELQRELPVFWEEMSGIRPE